MTDPVHTLIVGGGLAGLCAARSAAELGTVVLATLDHPSDGEATSAAVMAGLANPLMGRRGNPVWHADDALGALERLLEAMGPETVDRTPGVIRPAVSSWQVDDFRRSAMERPDLATWWDADRTAQTVPWLHAPRGSLVIQRGCAIDIPSLLSALSADASDRGVSIMEGWRLAAWDEDGEAATAEFETAEGTVSMRAHRLVLALGPGFETFDLLAALSLHSIKGQLVRVRPRELPDGLRAVSGSGYAVPSSDGTVVIGSTYEHMFDDVAASREVSQNLLDRTLEMLPWLEDAEIVEERAGIRVTVPDTRLPMVGILPGQQRTWILTGLGSKGLLMAPFLAESLPGWFEDPGSIPHELSIQLD